MLMVSLLLMFFRAAVFADDVAPFDSFQGPVQSVVEEQAVAVAQADGTSKLSGRVIRKKSLVAASGHVSEETSYTESGAFGRKEVFHYNDKNQVTDWSGYDASDKILWKYTYGYDQLDRLMEENSYDATGALEAQDKYVYDGTTPAVLSKTTFDEKGEKKSVYTYFYDAAKRPIGWQTQYADGTVHKKNVKEYDAEGKLKQEYSMNASGTVFERITYSSQADKSSSRVSSYDDAGKLRDETVSLRDQYGNVVEESHFLADGSLDWKNVYDYHYDDHQNWIQKSSTQENQQFGKVVTQLVAVTYRTIAYTAASPPPAPPAEAQPTAAPSTPSPASNGDQAASGTPAPQAADPAKK